MAKWCQLASWALTIIDSGNVMSSVWCQAIAQTSDDLLFIEPLGMKVFQISIIILNISIGENVFENVVRKVANILFKILCVHYCSVYQMPVLVWWWLGA